MRKIMSNALFTVTLIGILLYSNFAYSLSPCKLRLPLVFYVDKKEDAEQRIKKRYMGITTFFTEQEFKDFIAIYENIERLKDRCNRISRAIEKIEEMTGIPNFEISEASKRAILKTYLKNSKVKIDPETIVKRPLLDSPIDREKANKWIEAHPPELQRLATLVVEHTIYIDQEKFEDALGKSIEQFDSNLENRPYILLVYKNNRAARRGGSNSWVYELSIEKGLRPPKAVINIADIEERENLRDLIKKGISDMVIIDDASYSARDIIEKYLGGIKEEVVKKDIHLVIPFATKTAEELIFRSGKIMGIKQIQIYKQYNIETVSEIFGEITEGDTGGKDLFGFLEKVYSEGREVTVLTYFQHKIADIFSATVLNGVVIDMERRSKAFIRFIPEVNSSYSEGYLDWVKGQIRHLLVRGKYLLKAVKIQGRNI